MEFYIYVDEHTSLIYRNVKDIDWIKKNVRIWSKSNSYNQQSLLFVIPSYVI